MNRRDFLHTTFASALAASLRAADASRPKRILLRSSWQTVNIGDIGHTPGMLALLEKYLPEVEVRLWKLPGVEVVGEHLAAGSRTREGEFVLGDPERPLRRSVFLHVELDWAQPCRQISSRWRPYPAAILLVVPNTEERMFGRHHRHQFPDFACSLPHCQAKLSGTHLSGRS